MIACSGYPVTCFPAWAICFPVFIYYVYSVMYLLLFLPSAFCTFGPSSVSCVVYVGIDFIVLFGLVCCEHRVFFFFVFLFVSPSFYTDACSVDLSVNC